MTTSPSPIANPSVSGNWPSWVTPELVAGRTLSFSELRTAGNWTFWLESRPDEQGRSVITGRNPDGKIHDLIPPGYSVGTRVHEYGGGAWDVRLKKGVPQVVFSDRKRGGVWFSDGTTATQWAEAGEIPEHRYADLTFDLTSDAVFCVRETHGEGVPVAALVHVHSDGRETVLVEGADFYAAPRPSPDGCFLAWFSWNDPAMPWTVTTLCVAPLDRTTGTLGPVTNLSGPEPCSIIEPCWSPDCTLYATSDASGRWTPIRFSHDDTDWHPHSLNGANAEIGLPHWVFGQRSMVPLPGNRLLALGIRHGLNHVLLEDNGRWTDVSLGTPVNVPQPLEDGRFAWIDSPADAPAAIATGRIGEPCDRFRNSVTLPPGVTKADIATPTPLTFPTTNGAEAHALFYAPASSTSALREGEKPPLVVMAHGGPTGRANPSFAFKVQWWTSRGFAVLDVNYRGSTGFGRAYREALDRQWGVADIEDCLAGVKAVLDRGLADPARCVIRGSSAGGLTVLGALAQSDLFAAGTSLYGVTDLRALAEETHKFEARYLDGLIGPYPEDEAVYLKRSPITQAGGISVPVLFLHGGADKVVPLSQAESMRTKLEHSALHVYPEEAHGFRARETIEDALQRELAFYQQVFNS
ncbi:S9 family peptidase [Gluconobacter kanchanaburiensis]|uniref:Peptidase n=1 Tax=Gluconobacter kanchanaburiensis NBRC 103587 TaxID=1307948 RepID=A0A511B527_9PROT|nr:prolyl oligopeptidase family serine peptidase [Gluconobacter kanchanaburiensis]MBF0861925.1 S9 family peptidase [Gluconobacter kanchanaburiensis]GBR67794.1 peptidase S9 [Gluconobacter kanchanaburiensis NBRC 103587]GEK95550.1 peptidase [Gluconobacter kanchanaburiensis NBRC 103587]